MAYTVKNWFAAAGIRAVKTMAQTAVAMIPVGLTIYEVSLEAVLGTALLSGIVSLLTSVAGIPEIGGGEDLLKIATNEGDDR